MATKLLIFDQSSNSLKQYSQPTAEEKSQWQLSSSTLNLYDFKATSTNCYLLIKESETTTVLAEISPEMSLVTHKFDTQPLISPASQSAMLFATDNSNFYVYRKQSSTIIKYSFENINHKLTYISTINLGDTSPAIESDIKDLTYFDGKLLALTQDNKIYSIATEPDFNGNYITTLLLDYEITNIKSIYSTNDLAQSYMIVNNKITNI